MVAPSAVGGACLPPEACAYASTTAEQLLDISVLQLVHLVCSGVADAVTTEGTLVRPADIDPARHDVADSVATELDASEEYPDRSLRHPERRRA